jgi:hypothetical protein
MANKKTIRRIVEVSCVSARVHMSHVSKRNTTAILLRDPRDDAGRFLCAF